MFGQWKKKMSRLLPRLHAERHHALTDAPLRASEAAVLADAVKELQDELNAKIDAKEARLGRRTMDVGLDLQRAEQKVADVIAGSDPRREFQAFLLLDSDAKPE